MFDFREELQRFWVLEELSANRILTPKKAFCEQLFMSSHTRDSNGRYTMRLPRSDTSLDCLEDSCGALQLLLPTERCLGRDLAVKTACIEFMNAYSNLGHIEPITEAGEGTRGVYYLPHYAVVKSSDADGKIRVVFNALFWTTTGLSLNDLLLPEVAVGPLARANSVEVALVCFHHRHHQDVSTDSDQPGGCRAPENLMAGGH